MLDLAACKLGNLLFLSIPICNTSQGKHDHLLQEKTGLTVLNVLAVLIILVKGGDEKIRHFLSFPIKIIVHINTSSFITKRDYGFYQIMLGISIFLLVITE